MIRILALSAATVALALAAGAAASAPEPSALADIDHHLVCPEALSSDEARTDALRDFMEGVSRAAPDMTISDVLAYRKTLLARHGCARTLQNLANAAEAVAKGDVKTQAWFPLGRGHQPVNLFVSSDHLKLVTDPRRPDEQAVETYAKIVFATPQVTNVTHVTYDEVISHNVYYCKTGAYALVENDYFLAGKVVFKDPSPVQATIGGAKVYETEAIPTGSLNQIAADWACGTVKGGAA